MYSGFVETEKAVEQLASLSVQQVNKVLDEKSELYICTHFTFVSVHLPNLCLFHITPQSQLFYCQSTPILDLPPVEGDLQKKLHREKSSSDLTEYIKC